jgi:hypothetical protein
MSSVRQRRLIGCQLVAGWPLIVSNRFGKNEPITSLTPYGYRTSYVLVKLQDGHGMGTAGEGEGNCAGQYVSESSLACRVFYLRYFFWPSCKFEVLLLTCSSPRLPPSSSLIPERVWYKSIFFDTHQVKHVGRTKHKGQRGVPNTKGTEHT